MKWILLVLMVAGCSCEEGKCRDRVVVVGTHAGVPSGDVCRHSRQELELVFDPEKLPDVNGEELGVIVHCKCK